MTIGGCTQQGGKASITGYSTHVMNNVTPCYCLQLTLTTLQFCAPDRTFWLYHCSDLTNLNLGKLLVLPHPGHEHVFVL